MWQTTLREKATVWAASPDGYGGFTFSAPTKVMCRWQDRQEEFVDFQGRQLVSASVVYLESKVDPGSFIALGEFTAADPVSVGAKEVKSYSRTHDLRNMQTLHKVHL